MAQLSDDCFGGGPPSMTIEEAIALATQKVPVVAGSALIDLREADGRIAAEDIFARNDLPPFANSAVDGYAVRHADLSADGETVMRVDGRVTAGSSEHMSAAGRAVRIFTGAAMPADADTVFMQEDVSVEDSHVRLPTGLKRGANMRPSGEDVGHGELVIRAGRVLGPQDVALAAATGHSHILVRQPLRVAIFSTGNELVEPGGQLKPGAIFDSNRIMLGALLRRSGAKVLDHGILPDKPDILSDRLTMAAQESDLILTSGGVSLGEEDHVKTAIISRGQLFFWRLAIKPGRPLAMGTVQGTPFVGLPGNPAAAYVTFVMFVRHLLAHLAGAAPRPLIPIRVRSGFSAKKKARRREFVRVNVTPAADGWLEAHRFPKEGAALLTSLTTSDGLAEISEDVTRIEVGDVINFYPHDAF